MEAVPVESTKEMFEAAIVAFQDPANRHGAVLDEVYKAMLAAAPQPPAPVGEQAATSVSGDVVERAREAINWAEAENDHIQVSTVYELIAEIERLNGLLSTPARIHNEAIEKAAKIFEEKVRGCFDLASGFDPVLWGDEKGHVFEKKGFPSPPAKAMSKRAEAAVTFKSYANEIRSLTLPEPDKG